MNINWCIAAAFTQERVSSNEVQQHEWELMTFLDMVATELKPERTVELGTYRGWTAAALSHVTSGHTVTVDIEDHGPQTALSYGRQLSRLVADATKPDTVLQALAILGGAMGTPIDLLFIDDGHYYEQIKVEFDLWSPCVRAGGWIVFHDINPLANIGPHGTQPECIQVPRFWQELKGDKREIIATENHRAWKGHLPHGGLGILKI